MSWWDLKDSLLGNTRAPEEGDSELLNSTSESEEGELVAMAETIDNTTGTGERALFFLFGSLRAMMRGQGPSAGCQVERAHALIEKLEERMETIEDLLDQLVDMVPQVQEDAEKKKQEIYRQISRVRQAALNKIANYEIRAGSRGRRCSSRSRRGCFCLR